MTEVLKVQKPLRYFKKGPQQFFSDQYRNTHNKCIRIKTIKNIFTFRKKIFIKRN